MGVEVREFLAFVKWLRLEVEVQALDDGSERKQEIREGGGEGIEYRVVLDYLGGSLERSKLWLFVGGGGMDTTVSAPGMKQAFKNGKAANESSMFWLNGGDSESGYYETYKKARRAAATAASTNTGRVDKSPSNADKPMPKLDQLLARLGRQCETVFAQIAASLRKSIMYSHMLELPSECDPEVMDMRIIPATPMAAEKEGMEARREGGVERYDICVIAKANPNVKPGIAGAGKGAKEVPSAVAAGGAIVVFSKVRGMESPVADIEVVNTRSSLSASGSGCISIPGTEELEVRDVRFVDDREVLVLASPSPSVGVEQGKEPAARIYSADVEVLSHFHRRQNDGPGEEDDVWRVRHVFASGAGTRPAKMEVNGRKGRRVICVLDETGMGYTVFDLDHNAATVDGEGEKDLEQLGEDGEEGEDQVMTG